MEEEKTGTGSGLLGMFNAFIDPGGLAKAVRAKLFWLWPLLTLLIIYIVCGYLLMPYTLQFTDYMMNQRMAGQNIPPERLETAKNMAHMFATASVGITPVFILLMLALAAWLVTVMGSVVGVRAKFRDVFSIVAACSLITSLQYIATYIVIHAKGDEITSQEQFMQPFGLDIFLQNVHGPLLALLNYFSIFQIWYLVMLTLSLAALAGVSKGKAFAAITPAWVLPLLFRVVGAMFSGGAASS